MRGYEVFLLFFICMLCPIHCDPIYLNDPVKQFDQQAGRNAARELALSIVDGIRQVRNSGRGFALTTVFTLENCRGALKTSKGASALQKMKQADSTLLYVLPVFYEQLSTEIEKYMKELKMDTLKKDTPEMNHQITVNTECVKPALMDLRV